MLSQMKTESPTITAAELDRLRADMARVSVEFGLPPEMVPAPGWIAQQVSRWEQQERELARLRAALKPFATHYKPADLHQIGGGTEVAVPFPVQDYKDAIKAYHD